MQTPNVRLALSDEHSIGRLFGRRANKRAVVRPPELRIRFSAPARRASAEKESAKTAWSISQSIIDSILRLAKRNFHFIVIFIANPKHWSGFAL
jgi:hypothetical protein